jgi:hypothetical protein
MESAFTGLERVRAVTPNAALAAFYQEAYQRWLQELRRVLVG